MIVRSKILFEHQRHLDLGFLERKEMAEVKRTICVAHSTTETCFLNDLILHSESCGYM